MKRVLKKVLKWVGYILLTLIVLTVTTVLFLLNSTKTIQWAADTYAPQYGFAYKQISGGLLTGLEVEELTFKNDKLLDHLKIGWNPAAILYKKISITHLDANGLNVSNIKKVIEAFVPTEPKEENTSAFVLPVSIGVGELHLTVNPFGERGIGFKDISLDGKGIVYYGEGDIGIDDLLLSIDTNVTTIELSGEIQEKKIRIKRLNILDIDTMAFQDMIEKMIAIKIHEEIVEVVEPEVEQYKAGKDNFIPKSVQVDSVIVTVKPADYPQIRVSQGELNATSIEVNIHGMIDLQPNTVQVGDLSLLVDTNLSKLSMQSKLQDETITVELLSLQDIDTIALTNLFESIEYNQTAKTEPKVSLEDKTIDNNSTANPLLPKFLYVKQLDSSIKSATYDPVFVKSAEVNATNVKLNIGTLTAERGEVDAAVVSSFASLVQHGVIKDNQLESKGHITALKELFETYDLPLKEDLFGKIPLNINVDEKQAVIDMDIGGEEILLAKEDEFNVEHLSLKNHITYLIPEAKLTVKNEGNISTPYAKDIHFENVLTLEDGVLDYKGKVDPGTLEGIDANYTKPLNDLKITYQGDAKSIEALINSEGVEGKFVSADFKKGDLRLSMTQPYILKNIISLPKELHSSQVEANIHVPLDFSAILPLNANAKIKSNFATVDADIFYDKELKIMSKIIFPEDSLLRTFSPRLNLDAFSPLQADLTMVEKALHVDVNAKGLASKVKFNPENKNLEGNLVLGGAKFVFKGNVEKELSLDNSVSSLENLLTQMSTIYAFKVPPLDGDAKVSLVLTDMKEIELKFNSNTLTYKADSDTEHILRDTMISLGFSDSILALNKYHTTFQELKIFATKPSLITLKEGNVEIAPLWINDTLKVTGAYNTETQKGEIISFSDLLNISHEMVDLESHIDIKTSFNKGKTNLEGTVTILGGDIHYDMAIKTFSSDRDIINAEVLKKKKNSLFMDNLSTTIKVNTEKPLTYKTADADIIVNTDLLIQKAEKGPARILGMVEILEGSSYRFAKKKFFLKKSAIHFTGDPNKLILDIVATYKTVQAEISIQVTGNPANPNIVLSSIPRMSRQKILSTILFGTQANDEDMSEEDMMSMMGSTMAQSVFSNSGTGIVRSAFSHIGINIDAIPFIGGSVDANQTKKALFSFFSREEEVVIPHHAIHFRGENHIAENELQKAMGVDTQSIFQFWKADKPTIKDKLLPTLEQSLRNFYDSKGFYDAAFSIETSKTDVTVSIDENKPVKISDVNISSDYDISDLITFEEGTVFRSKEFVSIKRKIIGKLMKEGYCSYDLDSKAYVDLDRHEVSVHFTLKKGGVCTFGKTRVGGLETIDNSVVLSRVRTREGERFNIERIRETHDAIYALDAFDSVSVRHDRKFYNVVPIDVAGVEVERPWYVKGDVDYDNDVGVRVSAQVLRTNFMGNAKQIGLNLAYSNIEKLAEVNYFVPVLFNISDYYIDLTSKAGYREFRYTGFKEEKGYAQTSFDYNDEKLSVKAGFALENINISLFDDYAWVQGIEEGTFLLAGPFLGFAYDARDSKLDPKYGYYITGMVEYALPYDDEASSYLKYTLEGRAIYTFSDLTLSAVAKAGSVEQIQNEIPESKLFFAGGVNSNRAYGYKRVGFILSPTSYGIAGGSTMANLSLEANYPIWEDLYGAVFTDNTMLTNDKFNFSGDVLSSAGLGIRYKTPIGPLKIDVGMNVEDTSQYGVQFQIGQSF